MLTGKQILQAGIITMSDNFLVTQEEFQTINPQQHSVDLNLVIVRRLSSSGGIGVIPRKPDAKTKLCKRLQIEPTDDPEFPEGVWVLPAGAYDITFAQGCKIPNDQRLKIVQRSSLLRNGGLLSSSIFDSGYSTSGEDGVDTGIGTVVVLFETIKIAVGARIATAYVEPSNIVQSEDLYQGQWQGNPQQTNPTIANES